MKNDNLVAPINLKSDFSSTESEDEDDVPIWKNGSEKLRIKKSIKINSTIKLIFNSN